MVIDEFRFSTFHTEQCLGKAFGGESQMTIDISTNLHYTYGHQHGKKEDVDHMCGNQNVVF